MTFMLLGPLSSGSPGGPGPFFSYLFVLMGCYVLIKTWLFYLKYRSVHAIQMYQLVGISIISLFFIVAGVWGILR